MILFRSFKFRLAVIYSLLMMVFFIGFSFLTYSLLSRALYQNVEKNLRYEAKQIEEGLLSFFYASKEAYFVKLPENRKGSISFSPDFQVEIAKKIREWESHGKRITRSRSFLRIVGLDGEAIGTNLGGWSREILFPDFERDSVFMEFGESYQTIHFQKRPIRLFYHLTQFRGRPFFVIEVAESIDEIGKTLARLQRTFMLIIPIGLVLICFLGWFLAKRFLLPVDKMIQEARKITATYLGRRLPRTQAKDELDRLAETLNEMLDRLEASTNAVREFSSNVSHEFKTPLAIIRGEVDLAMRRNRSAEELQKTMKIISEEVDGLTRLVNDLMLLVKSDAKQLNIQKETISLKSILEQVFEQYSARAIQANVKLVFKSLEEGSVSADPIYLKMLFMNLVDNAVKFTEKNGSVFAFVKSQTPGWITATIEDTGPGIDEKTLQNIGKRFYRSDSARSKEGSGLGLSIVKIICEAHRGVLRFESEEGRGAKISVDLPLLD